MAKITQAERVKPWLKAKGDSTMRVDYELSSESRVWDVGGYQGDFAAEMVGRYDCEVWVWEPVLEFYERIVRRFEGSKKVQVFNYGLGASTRLEQIALKRNASSIFGKGSCVQEIKIVGVQWMFERMGEGRVDLMKINIEGGEYELLWRMIELDLCKRVRNIQVQFHSFVLGAEDKMTAIQAKLAITHHLTYQYPFVWENWEINNV